MQCIKCGRETEPKQVFCPDCLASMEKAPVKPGTPVTLPKRPKREYVPPVKKDKPEEVIFRLRRQIKGLTITIITLVVALGISIGIIAFHFATTEHNGLAIGSNYSTESSGEPRSR